MEIFPWKTLALSSYFSNTVNCRLQGLCATYIPHNVIWGVSATQEARIFIVYAFCSGEHFILVEEHLVTGGIGHPSLVTRSMNKLQIQKSVFLELDYVGMPAAALVYL